MDTTSVSYGCEVDEVDADVGVLERLVVVLVDGNGPAVGVPEIGVVIVQVVRFRRPPPFLSSCSFSSAMSPPPSPMNLFSRFLHDHACGASLPHSSSPLSPLPRHHPAPLRSTRWGRGFVAARFLPIRRLWSNTLDREAIRHASYRFSWRLQRVLWIDEDPRIVAHVEGNGKCLGLKTGKPPRKKAYSCINGFTSLGWG
jgi:hypothetical protein